MYNGDAADSNISSIDTLTITKGLIPTGSNTSELDYADLGGNGWKYYCQSQLFPANQKHLLLVLTK